MKFHLLSTKIEAASSCCTVIAIQYAPKRHFQFPGITTDRNLFPIKILLVCKKIKIAKCKAIKSKL